MKLKEKVLGLNRMIAKVCLTPILKREQQRVLYPDANERPVEYAYTMAHLRDLCPKTILDIGPGKSAWPHVLANCGFKVTAIDKVTSYWKGSYFNRHFYVQNDDITNPQLTGKFQGVLCLSVLEHIPDHNASVKSMIDLLEPGGHLILTFPYNEETYHENIYAHPDAGYGQDAKFVTQVYSREQIDGWVKASDCEIIDQEYWQIFNGEFWTMGGRIHPSKKVDKTDLHHLTCLVIRKAD